MPKKIIFILIFFLIVGCDSKNKIKMEEELFIYEGRTDALEKFISSVATYNDYVIFSPASKDYQLIHSKLGNFFVCLDNISKYADGYKVTLLIGNPNSVTFNNMILTLEWGPQMDVQHLDEWEKQLKKRTEIINYPILSSTWNKVIFILSPAKDIDTGYIKVSLEGNSIELLPDLR